MMNRKALFEKMKKRVPLFLLILSIPFMIYCFKSETGVTFMVGGAPGELAYWEKMIEAFEEDSGIRIRMIRQPSDSDQRRQQLIVPLHAGLDDPDVFLMDIVWVTQFIESGWLEPLDDYIEKSGVSIKPFFRDLIQSVDIAHDTLWALPVYADAGILYYRTDLLNKYGYRDPPNTWQDLIRFSSGIQEKERQRNPNFWGFVWQGFQYEGLVCTFLEFCASFGGGFNPENNALRINTPANSKALRFMRDLIQRYRISPPSVYTEMKEEEARIAFQRGDALFERNWPYAWVLHRGDDSPVRNMTGMAYLPHLKNVDTASVLGGWHIGISKNSDKKESAWQLVRFITSYNGAKQLALNLGWTPGREDVYEDPEILKKYPHFIYLKSIYSKTVARPALPYYSRFSEIIQRYVHACISGKIGPEKALSEMQKKLTSIHDAYEEQADR
jgi:multiple sugar transport system substrate-binding protein